MTNENAINILRHLIPPRTSKAAFDAFRQAIDMAIEALEERGDNMSSMIQCDKCRKTMYADSRSDKGDWCTVRIDYVDGLSTLHLCKVCHRQFFVEFTKTMKPEEYDEEFGSWWNEEVTE